jgi:hypothetical protein
MDSVIEDDFKIMLVFHVCSFLFLFAGIHLHKSI